MGERAEALQAGTVRGRAVAPRGKREQVEVPRAGTEAARPVASSAPAGARVVAAEPPERPEWDLVDTVGPLGPARAVAELPATVGPVVTAEQEAQVRAGPRVVRVATNARLIRRAVARPVPAVGACVVGPASGATRAAPRQCAHAVPSPHVPASTLATHRRSMRATRAGSFAAHGAVVPSLAASSSVTSTSSIVPRSSGSTPSSATSR
jgi:hypothetical protein